MPTSFITKTTTFARAWAAPRQGLLFGGINNCSKKRLIRHRSICRMDSAKSTPGADIFVYNEQDVLDVNLEQLKDTISRIRFELGYDDYSVTLVLVEDEEMRSINLESRGVDAPTDILSFPFHPHVTPGTLEPPEFDIPDLYTLGDMMLDVPYVMRRCQEDSQVQEEEDEEEERGVSGAMAKVENPEQRINMLMVHGMLHLLGYDHIEDDDYELMVKREEELLEKLAL